MSLTISENTPRVAWCLMTCLSLLSILKRWPPWARQIFMTFLCLFFYKTFSQNFFFSTVDLLSPIVVDKIEIPKTRHTKNQSKLIWNTGRAVGFSHPQHIQRVRHELILPLAALNVHSIFGYTCYYSAWKLYLLHRFQFWYYTCFFTQQNPWTEDCSAFKLFFAKAKSEHSIIPFAIWILCVVCMISTFRFWFTGSLTQVILLKVVQVCWKKEALKVCHRRDERSRAEGSMRCL